MTMNWTQSRVIYRCFNYLETMADKKTPQHIILQLTDRAGADLKSPIPFRALGNGNMVHDDLDVAQTEAAAARKEHKGYKFGVFTLIER